MPKEPNNPRVSKSPSKPSGKSPPPVGHFARNTREIIESVAIAFILAFLFRTFEAEAFVIPTGSMAPTLMGRHKDVECPKCGYEYESSASYEDSTDVQIAKSRLPHATGAERTKILSYIRSYDTVAATCPLCRYTIPLAKFQSKLEDSREAAHVNEQPSYNGDRILVSKFAYEFAEPERWDVIVFKYPGDGNQNYIKRLVGLPGETIRIYQGDLLVQNRQGGRGEHNLNAFSIERKPPRKVLSMMHLIHDTAHDPSELRKAGWPLRWSSGDERWQVEEDATGQTVSQTYTTSSAEDDGAEDDGAQGDAAWLRYRHVVPDMQEWLEIDNGGKEVWDPSASDSLEPQLITDLYAYNTEVLRGSAARAQTLRVRNNQLGLHWVGDLLVECDVEVVESGGALLLDLVEGGKHFTCTIDLSTGNATFGIEGLDGFSPTAETAVRGIGKYRLRFGNIDDQLLLWVNDKLIRFGDEEGSAEYDVAKVFGNRKSNVPTAEDLSPVGVGSQGAAITIRQLRIYRDVYYIADAHDAPDADNPISDLPRRSSAYHNIDPTSTYREGINNFLANPKAWEILTARRAHDFSLRKDAANPRGDQFFVLGDNSPASKDARLWAAKNDRDQITGAMKIPGGPYVERKLLIGKALIVFWPHSWNHIPGVGVPLPFFPNFGDMRLIR